MMIPINQGVFLFIIVIFYFSISYLIIIFYYQGNYFENRYSSDSPDVVDEFKTYVFFSSLQRSLFYLSEFTDIQTQLIFRVR